MNEKTRALIFTSLGHYLNDNFIVLMSILIVYYIIEGVSPAFLAIATAAYSIISGLLSTPIGSVADRKGNFVELMLFGFILIGIANIIFAASFVMYSLYFIALGAVFLGSGAAFYHPLGASILQIKYGREEAPKALGINGSMGSLGRAIFPTILVFLLSSIGKVDGLLVVSAYTFILAAVTYLGLRGITFAAPPKGAGSTAAKSSLRKYAFILVPLSVTVFVRSMFITGVTTYVPTYMTNLYRSAIVMGIVLTASYSMAIIGQPYFGRITASLGGRSVLIITTVGATLSFLMFLLIKEFYLQVMFFAVYSFFAYSGFPNLLGYVGQVVDRDALTRANGIIWGVANTVGGAAGVLLGGSLITIIGLGNVMWVFAIIAIASTALLVTLPKSKQPLKAS